MSFFPHTHRVPAGGGEWEMVQELLRQTSSPIVQEFLLHYYISAKTWPLVLLIGRPRVGKRRLFQLLANGIVGCVEGQIRLLPSQPAWGEHENTGNGKSRPYLDSIRGRFNTMAFLDQLAQANTPGNEGQTYFLALEQATPQELTEYMELYMAQAQGNEEGAPALPSNLYLTAILPVEGGAWCLPPALLNRVGLVEVSAPLGEENIVASHCPPVGWQRMFLRNSIRDEDRARRRMQGFDLLREFDYLYNSVQTALTPEMGPEWQEGLLLYAANSFTSDGEGLLESRPGANLRQAFDLQLAQRILPCIFQRSFPVDGWWSELLDHLDGVFPRAHARVRRILLERAESAGKAQDVDGGEPDAYPWQPQPPLRPKL